MNATLIRRKMLSIEYSQRLSMEILHLSRSKVKDSRDYWFKNVMKRSKKTKQTKTTWIITELITYIVCDPESRP